MCVLDALFVLLYIPVLPKVTSRREPSAAVIVASFNIAIGFNPKSASEGCAYSESQKRTTYLLLWSVGSRLTEKPCCCYGCTLHHCDRTYS